jgi:hypothetical protein
VHFLYLYTQEFDSPVFNCFGRCSLLIPWLWRCCYCLVASSERGDACLCIQGPTLKFARICSELTLYSPLQPHWPELLQVLNVVLLSDHLSPKSQLRQQLNCYYEQLLHHTRYSLASTVCVASSSNISNSSLASSLEVLISTGGLTCSVQQPQTDARTPQVLRSVTSHRLAQISLILPLSWL